MDISYFASNCIKLMVLPKIFRPTLFLFTLCTVLASCQKDNEVSISEKPQYMLGNSNYEYLHISHFKTSSTHYIESTCQNIDYNHFDAVLLGGDLTERTSLNDSTLEYLDSFLNLSSASTLWSLGNHDTYDNLDKIENITNKNSFYSHYQNGNTFIVINNQLEDGIIKDEQLWMIEDIADTISESNNLILLQHKLMWMEDHPQLAPLITTIPNGSSGTCYYCIPPNNFNSEVYPLLLKIKQRGINVICISGDLGKKAKQFAYTTDDGIHLLASGIQYDKDFNMALILKPEPFSNVLEWEFVDIKSLPEKSDSLDVLNEAQ